MFSSVKVSSVSVKGTVEKASWVSLGSSGFLEQSEAQERPRLVLAQGNNLCRAKTAPDRRKAVSSCFKH